nr:hypothetical protein [Petrotoga sp. 9PW.55.5.1]
MDNKIIMKLVDYFWTIREKYSEYDMSMKSIDARILNAQIPGGMLSNLVSQLKAQKAENKLEEVLEEVPRVRKDLGYPPLVTPTSQIVGVQAVLNVLTGKRYSMITNEVKNYLKGLYGRSPAAVDKELYKKALGSTKSINHRPADDLEAELENAKKEIGILAKTEEDLLTYTLFKEVGRKFLKDKYIKSLNIDFSLAENFKNEDTAIYPV